MSSFFIYSYTMVYISKITNMNNINTQQLDSTLNLKHLYDLADNIQKLKKNQETEYGPITFGTIFSGVPNIYTGLNLPIILIETFPSYMDSGFTGIGSHVIVDCRKLDGIYDLDRRQIYEGLNGSLFVYSYTPPTSMSKVDKGIFLPPRIAFEESKQINTIFNKASETLLNQFKIPDPMTILTLSNRITELQINAYIQGKNSVEIRPLNELLQPIENITSISD